MIERWGVLEVSIAALLTTAAFLTILFFGGYLHLAPGIWKSEPEQSLIKFSAGDWNILCHDKTRSSCAAEMRLTRKETNKFILNWTIGYSKKDELLSILRTPPDLSPTKQMAITVEQQNILIGPPSCLKDFCEYVLPMHDHIIKMLSAHSQARMIYGYDDKPPMNFVVPIGNFDAVVRHVRK